MDSAKALTLFNFATQLEALKKMERYKGHFYWRDYPQPDRYESVADHTWRLGMLVLLLADELSQKIDLEKALTITLVHDVHEIVAGDDSPVGNEGTGKDTYAFDKEKADERREREKKAAHSFFGQLPRELSTKLFDAWLDYAEQQSFEARVVHALDKLEAMLQVLEYRQGQMFEKHLTFTIDYCLKDAHIDPAIMAFGETIAQELRNRFKKFDPS